MQLWIAAVMCLAGLVLVATFLWRYYKDKKKRFLNLALATLLLVLAVLIYAVLTLILIGGMD